MSPTDEQPRRPQRRSRVLATLRALIRTRVTAGLLVVLPIYITVLLLRFVFEIMRDSSQWLVEAYLTSEAGAPLRKILKINLEKLAAELGHQPTPAELYAVLPPYMQWGISIASVLFTIFILYVIGLFTANIIGRRVIEALERLVDKVPLVKTVYRSSKQILATITGGQSQSFQRVALIPFPDSSMRAVGFITNVFTDSVTGEELCSVFIPTTPNPTTGYLQVIRRGDLTEVPWTVEEAVRVIMSAGILRPDFITIVPNKQLPEGMPQGVGPTALRPPPRPPLEDSGDRPPPAG